MKIIIYSNINYYKKLMDLLNLYQKEDLDEVIELVSQKKFIHNVHEWLKKKQININTKIFISHYLLWRFNMFHGVPNNSLLYESCSKITEAVKNDQKIQGVVIEQYKNSFELWKQAHSDDMIDEYTETIEKLKEFKEAEPDPENKKGYEIFQNTLEESIEMLKRNNSVHRERSKTI